MSAAVVECTTRSGALTVLASKLKHALRRAKKELKDSDFTRFVEPLQNILADITNELEPLPSEADGDYGERYRCYCVTSVFSTQSLQLRVSHNYQPICSAGWARRAYQWTLSVEALAFQHFELGPLLDFIDKVSFSKVPNTRVLRYGSCEVDEDEDAGALPDELFVCEGPFELTATSWKAARVDVTIFLKNILNQEPIRLQHLVDFNVESARTQLYNILVNPSSHRSMKRHKTSSSHTSMEGAGTEGLPAEDSPLRRLSWPSKSTMHCSCYTEVNDTVPLESSFPSVMPTEVTRQRSSL